ncbi:hypothetical protein J6590_040960 [Homalodisca vitripennis]|nr:hypothetical protein J6590_040960 [Homalodisca vitripennis]
MLLNRCQTRKLPHVRMIAFSNIQSASESVRIMSVDNREMYVKAPQQVSNSQAPSRLLNRCQTLMAPHVRMIAFNVPQSASESRVRIMSVSNREMCSEAPQQVSDHGSTHDRMIAFGNIQSAEAVDKQEMCGEAPQQVSDSQAPSR